MDAGFSDAVSLTYDALGRMVEQNRGSTYTQIAYSPSGQKLALMSGANLQKAMLPLTGNAQAVYNSSGLLYYAHPDLLGSIRLATTQSRVMYFDTAYAPFGETYASAGGANLDPAYTGQMNDTAHREDVAGGLYDFPVREYSTQGRWPNPDPLGSAAACPKNPQSQNLYAYVSNNPITHIDPTGAFEVDEVSCFPGIDPFCPCDILPFGCTGGGGGGGFGGGGGGGGGFLGGGGDAPRPFPWPQLLFGFFSALDAPTQGSPGGNKWDDCRKRVFVPCMNQAEGKDAQCRAVAGGFCVGLTAACSPLCGTGLVAPCLLCLANAAARCTGAKLGCSRQFGLDTANCFAKLISCVYSSLP